jgi:hypothetical protein
MKYVAYFLVLCCITLAMTYNYWAPQPPVGSRPVTVLYPEEVGEAEVGVPMFIDYVSPNRDTVSIVFDPMKDRLFWVRNPYCKTHSCTGNLIWVDLESLTIYIEDGHAEMVEFEDETHLIQNLYYVMQELGAGKRFDKKSGNFK